MSQAEQIAVVDQVVKECDATRKSLQTMTRSLDDLDEEVRRYRDFLNYQKARREPGKNTYKQEPHSNYNSRICVDIANLTEHLSQEWMTKLTALNANITPPTNNHRMNNQ